MDLQNNDLFKYLPQDYTVDEFINDEDEIYTIAHNIVISASHYASAVTELEFEDFDEQREDAILFVTGEIIKANGATRAIEMFYGEGTDNGTWDTTYVDIPMNTPDDKIREAGRDALRAEGYEYVISGVYAIPSLDDQPY